MGKEAEVAQEAVWRGSTDGREHGPESGALEGDAGDVAAGDSQGEEGQGRALGGEEQEPEED